MLYSPEFDFFSEILTDFKLSYTILRSSDDLKSLFSNFLNLSDIDKHINCTKYFQEFIKQCYPKIIYRIENFCLHFILFKLPNIEQTMYLAIGPYTLSTVPFLHQFYTLEGKKKEIPMFNDDQLLLNIVNTFIKRIFKDPNDILIKNINIVETSDIALFEENFYLRAQEDPLLNIRIIEEYYHNENEIMKFVSQGQWHKAEIFLNIFFNQRIFYRFYPLENELQAQKIQSFALNTLLRKSAESVDVHPIHIENLCYHFILKISQTDSKKDILYLQREIVRKYCQLVQTHSLKGYSPIIRKVITYIISNLSGDLTLNTQANLLSINPSYLSSLFKKETGTTLTEYVKYKRINHAVFLLNTSNLQIQVIAECCGISDVNYFTKIFKKIIGKTPKEYRNDILKRLFIVLFILLFYNGGFYEKLC